VKGASVEDALALILSSGGPLGVESVAIEDAAGRVLAEAVDADRDQPPFDSSAMDGWAIREADAAAAQAELTIVGESAAGRGYAPTLDAGEAVRIFTGAPVPAGADRVVIQEEAERIDAKVRLGPLKLGPNTDNIRPRGGDFHNGDRLLEPGVRLDAWRLSLAAAAGCGDLKVGRRPRVAVLSTGEELVRPPGRPGPFQIYESGSLALCALIDAWGGLPHRLAPARDDEQALIQAVQGVDVDLIVTVGGASVGDYDLVKPALTQLGLQLKLESVKIRPGKPTWFGQLGDGRKVLGLPGNPASALVCAELFLRPLLAAMQGASGERKRIVARLAEPLGANTGPRDHFMRAMLDHAGDGAVMARALRDQDSSLVTVFAQADALLRRPAGAPAAPAGETVEIIRLDRL
jgi:molybdopterin molybdotransferase